MKHKIFITIASIMLILITSATWVLAAKGIVAMKFDIDRLKRDVLAGKIQIGRTRLNQIRENYGDAKDITMTSLRIIYEYGDLRIEFDKFRYLKNWEIDTFKEAVFTDNVDNLRFSLESKQLVGKNITLTRILKNYKEPTEIHETDDDGALSVYYYGEIKLTFENRFLVKSWRLFNLETPESQGVLVR